MHTCGEYFVWLLSMLLDIHVQGEYSHTENALINTPVTTLRELKVAYEFGSMANTVSHMMPMNKLILQCE